jgi:hypothetical protein
MLVIAGLFVSATELFGIVSMLNQYQAILFNHETFLINSHALSIEKLVNPKKSSFNIKDKIKRCASN